MIAAIDRQEVKKGLASQTLRFFAPEGRPSASPTVAIKTAAGQTLSAAATTYVTLDPCTTTISASAAVGSQRLTLTAVTNVRIYTTYLIKNAYQQYEWVRVVKIDSTNKYVYLDEELEFAYANADTFVSTEFYYTLQTADVLNFNEENVAEATYAVTGYVTQPIEIVFDVVYRKLQNPLTVERVKDYWPNIMRQDFIEQQGEDFKRQIDAVWQDVRRELRQAGYTPGYIVDEGNVFKWAIEAFGLFLQRRGIYVITGVSPEIALEEQEKLMNAARDAAVASIEWYDKDNDRVKDEDTEKRPMRLHLRR